MAGKFLQTSLEHIKLEIGSLTSVFHLDFKQYGPLISPTWLTVLWEFIPDHDIGLRNAQPQQPRPLQLHDRALMDIFIRTPNYNLSTLTSINRVRCYLQVFLVADIATGDGTKVRGNYSRGLLGDSLSIWDWHEEHPSA